MPSRRKQRGAKNGGRWKVTPEWSCWSKEVLGIRVFLSELKDSIHPEGEAWRVGMQKHYRARLKALRDTEPPKYR